uniref:AlNc14C6G802 protein n=1 Tax=Albugo laibachii Nc14 TaxID=890382 RepID=F0W123_9STRA|nr:AlNc14C6G802 [Albugo laibachii Nc14]|eukprot:CCA14747.1 AlNc14C6G802 [Albugo laibachii Nc14]
MVMFYPVIVKKQETITYSIEVNEKASGKYWGKLTPRIVQNSEGNHDTSGTQNNEIYTNLFVKEIHDYNQAEKLPDQEHQTVKHLFKTKIIELLNKYSEH